MTTIAAKKPCALVQYDPLTGLFAQVREMRDRLLTAAAHIKKPAHDPSFQSDIKAIRDLLVQIDLSDAYRQAREKSIDEVSTALADHDELKHYLLYWKDLSTGQKITTMGCVAYIQSEVQSIGGIKGLVPRFRKMSLPKEIDATTGEYVVVQGRHTRHNCVVMDDDEIKVSSSNCIEFNGHPDAAALLPNAENGINIAAHEQQHDLQDSFQMAYGMSVFLSGTRTSDPLYRDARQFSLSLQCVLPQSLYSAYLDQVHERDARYVGEQVAARTMAKIVRNRKLGLG